MIQFNHKRKGSVMAKKLDKTGERLIPEGFSSKEEYLMYLRHIFAYNYAMKQISKNDRVLDVGSGEGYGTNILSKKAKSIVGLDVDKGSIEYANKKYKSKKCKFTYYTGKKIPFPDNEFDKVVSFQVIEHVASDEEYINEIYRVLKDGGIFIASTPNRNHRLKPNQKPWNRFHLREYSPEGLSKLLSKKFNIVNVWGIFGVDEVQDAEINRINKVRRMISLDPLGVRHVLPETLKLKAAKIARVLSKDTSAAETSNSYLQEYTIESYILEKNDITKSLDLFVYCKK